MTKGTALLSRVEFLKEHQRLDVLDQLNSEDRRAVQNALPVGQYPLALKARLDSLIALTLTPLNPDETYKELGRWSAAVNFEHYHGAFIRQGDLHGLLANAPQLRRLYYDDGESIYTRRGDRAGTIVMRGGRTVVWADCLGTAGYWEKALTLCGAKDPSVDHTKCIGKGADCCEYTIRWA